MSSPMRWILMTLLTCLAVACGAHQVQQQPAVQSADKSQKTQWQIEAKSVGPIVPGQLLPKAAFVMQGMSFEQLWSIPMKGLDEMSAIRRGLRDQDGFARVVLSKADLSIQLRKDLTVRTIWVGPKVRSAAGTGVHSTLSQLASAHGQLVKNDVPPPYQCSVTSASLPWVVFCFQEPCRGLVASSRVSKVFVMDPTADD